MGVFDDFVAGTADFGRNVMSLAGILPGVLAVNVTQQMDNARSGPIMDVNGGRSNMNLFTFNGGYFNNPSRNTGINYPPPDAIEEVRILTHDFSAEYGHNPGSQVLVASKPGFEALQTAFLEAHRIGTIAPLMAGLLLERFVRPDPASYDALRLNFETASRYWRGHPLAATVHPAFVFEPG